ncbi:MAG TPA: NAD(P)/FAD-dependent oxidoreductase [Candidatus Acidoferrales bacterium]|nr:NAD(P)/FAD-dependent oxidoreductase [Candidatus Acidoferrales bacterium]
MSAPAATSFDIVTIGGGLAASSFAKSMADRGAKVLILEQEERFRDRVRGEYLVPWGVAEARDLGVLDCLMQNCAREVPIVDLGMGPRDLRTTTPHQTGGITYSHPEMQETLIAAAEQSGVTVRRGVCVTGITPGAKPQVAANYKGQSESIAARLVVAADGRNSAVRKWVGFTVKECRDPFVFSGVLLSGVNINPEIGWLVFNAEEGLIGVVFAQPKNRFRAYLGYPTASGYRLNGKSALPQFLSESRRVAPFFADFYAKVEDIGPLASFDGGDHWAEHPYRDGVALLGDSAGTTDPSFGQGMALSLRDARTLRDALLKDSDWNNAGHRYAELHDEYYQRCRKAAGWIRAVFQEQGPEATARRERAMPLIAQDPMRVPDHLFTGPDLPVDDAVRARFFGES